MLLNNYPKERSPSIFRAHGHTASQTDRTNTVFVAERASYVFVKQLLGGGYSLLIVDMMEETRNSCRTLMEYLFVIGLIYANSKIKR
jgi:hypothetical protein